MRFRILALIVTLSLGAPRAVAQQVPSWDTLTANVVRAYQEGRYAEAEKSFASALKELESFGPDDVRLPQSLNRLAEVYRVQGRYGEAEALHRRALAIRVSTIIGERGISDRLSPSGLPRGQELR